MKQEHKDLIKELSELLRENSLHEIEYQENGVLLKVVAEGTTHYVPAEQHPVKAPVKEEKSEKEYLTSPMVGVIYLSPSPEAKPYLQVGDMVSVGQTIALVEAMKTFNPITAQKAGKVKEILVNSGAPVEFNQQLFELE